MTLTPSGFQSRFGVSRETLERLEIYVETLRKWTGKINLVSDGTLPMLWDRHIADSAQLFDVLEKRFASWADFGSGGGLPGAVVAILSADVVPDANFTLAEADQRKAAFLRTVSRETGVDFGVIAKRIEELPRQNCQILSARALAPLPVLLEYSFNHLADGGTGIFPKGKKYLEEIELARESWHFNCETFRSKTDDSAVILKVGDIQRV